MSNLGFHKAVEEIGLKDVVTQVVIAMLEEMRKMITILVANNLVT